MATTSGQSEPSIAQQQDLAALAAGIPSSEFFQAVRLVQRLLPGRDLVGYHGDPAAEAVRFRVRPTLNFPAQELDRLTIPDDAPPELSVLFLGLTGPVGVLPTHLTEFVLERLSARDATLRDFLDLFHHRLLSLFYRAWEKYRFGVPYERRQPVAFTQYLLCLTGLGTPGLADRQAIPDEVFAFYSGLFSQKPRSAAGLELILSDYFGVTIAVQSLTGGWRALDRGSWTVLSETSHESEQLGGGAVLGDEIWDPQSAVTLRVGPVTRAQYEEFLPGGIRYGPLHAFTRFYCGDDLDVEVQLVLAREEAPALELGGTDGLRLGWTSWILTAPPSHDPDDAVLRLWVE